MMGATMDCCGLEGNQSADAAFQIDTDNSDELGALTDEVEDAKTWAYRYGDNEKFARDLPRHKPPPSGNDTIPSLGALDGPKIDSQLEL
jgi:hypothetical protein